MSVVNQSLVVDSTGNDSFASDGVSADDHRVAVERITTRGVGAAPIGLVSETHAEENEKENQEDADADADDDRRAVALHLGRRGNAVAHFDDDVDDHFRFAGRIGGEATVSARMSGAGFADGQRRGLDAVVVFVVRCRSDVIIDGAA